MRNVFLLAACATAFVSSTAKAANITGEYLEARTCNVYTGECFANAEYGIAGKEALMAWKVDKGSWKGVELTGLGVALVVSAQNTLGENAGIKFQPGKVKSVILVDEKANKQQREALISFVKDSAKKLTKNVVKVKIVPIQLKNDHLENAAVFKAGNFAEIKTRKIQQGDCVCSNEIVFYPPLTKVDNFSPAHATTMSYQGKDLNVKWTNYHINGAFLATFRR